MKIREALDERWYSQLLIISKQIGETYIALEPSPEYLAQAREVFESSDFSCSVPLYPDTKNSRQLRSAAAALVKLQSKIETEESNSYVRQAYGDYIDNLLANTRMIIAAEEHDDVSFETQNEALYGSPDREVFSAVCAWIASSTQQAIKEASTSTKTRAAKVLSLLPYHNESYKLLIPSESIFHAVRQLHRSPQGYYDQLFGDSGLPSQPYIDQRDGDRICKMVLRNIGSDYTLAPSQNNVWATVRDRKLLLRPLGYRLDVDEFIGIISHEIGSHILEATNGARQPLRLLEIGLAGYEKGNEGRAFLREQIVYDKESTFLHQFAWEYILLLHLSVCLAIGYDTKPYSFAKLYELLFALYLFWRELRYPFETNNEAYARQEAWYLAVRVMKGTDGQHGAYRKDSVYLEGNIKCWKRATQDPAAILLGDSGKFDITNSNHLLLLRQLGIVEI